MKKTIALIIMVCMLFVACAFTGTACNLEMNAVDFSDFVLEEYLHGYKIKDYTGSDSELVIPSVYNGKPIIFIGNTAFMDKDSLKEVTIGKRVTEIGNRAFYKCDNLETIYIQKSVQKIGMYAFEDCIKLTNVSIPSTVKTIGTKAFNNCPNLKYCTQDNLNYLGNAVNPYLYLHGMVTKNIYQTTINENCRFIGNDVFNQCQGLEKIVIPNSVEYIDSNAFAECKRLKKIVVGAGIKKIDSGAFFGTAFTEVNYLGNMDDWVQIEFVDYDSNPMTFNGFCLNGVLLTEVKISTATKISTYAFYKNNDLTKVVIGNNVTKVEVKAFSQCQNLTIYCEADEIPSTWEYDWNYNDRPVFLGYKG